MVLYIPPNYHTDDRPLVFLAGPIQGAARWQNRAFEIISTQNSEIDIASPRYIGEREDLIGDWSLNVAGEKQIDWETYHLNFAGYNGAILFWLAREDKHYCNRAFAQTTRFELGEWVEKNLTKGANLVLGIDPEFPGGDYISYRLKMENSKIPIVSTLELACEKVLEIL